MTTFATLNTSCRNLLGDTIATFYLTDAQIDDWINAAIADLNTHFPRRTVITLTTVSGQHLYDLPNSLISIASLEYPTDEDPPSFLMRKAYTEPEFWLSDDYYDFLPSNDASSNNNPRLILSAEPEAGQTITIDNFCEHNRLSSPTDITTILSRHEHLIPLFVRWKAFQELSASEAYNPDPIKKLAGELELAAARAESAYRAALETSRKAESASAQTYWRMDKHDRVY